MEFEEVTYSNILKNLVNVCKLIKKKYAKNVTSSLPSPNNKTDSDKKNPNILIFKWKKWH